MASETTFDHWKAFFMRKSEKKGPNFSGPKVRILKFTYLESSHQIRQLDYEQILCLFFLKQKLPSGPMCTRALAVLKTVCLDSLSLVVYLNFS